MTTQPHVFIVKTSTPEKIKLYQMVADECHLPMLFFDVRDIAGTQHTTEEDTGTGLLNVDAKQREYEAVIADAGVKDSEADNNLHKLLSYYGVAHDPSTIHFATEDSEWGADIQLWRNLPAEKKQRFMESVPEYVLKRFDHKDAKFFPGAELAPMFSTEFGHVNLIKSMQEAFGRDPLPTTDMIHLFSQTLSSPEHVDEFTAQTSYNLRLDEDITDQRVMGDFLETSDGRRASTKNVLVNESSRADMVSQLAQKFSIAVDTNWKREVLPQHRVNVDKINPLFMTGASFGVKSDTKELKDYLYTKRKRREDIAPMLAELMYEKLKYAGEVLKESNVLWFEKTQFAQEKSSGFDLESLASQFLLSSAVVARQLNLSEAYKPFIVLNHNGCFDDELAAINRLVDIGMCKDFGSLLRIPLNGLEQTEGVKHEHNMYFHILAGDNRKELREAGKKIVDHLATNYYRSPALDTQDNTETESNVRFERASQKGQGIFKVGVFMSAGSENKQLNDDTFDFGQWLASRGYGAVYGAGDRYMMGSLVDGYQAGRDPNPHSKKKSFIAGFSTPEIIKSETKHSTLPECLDAGIMNKDIYERMAQMLAMSDVVVVRPGGVGTLQEMLAIVLMKETFKNIPEIANKKIIIQNPTVAKEKGGFYDPVLEQLFHAEKKTLEAHGIYVADSDEEIQSHIGAIKKSWDKSRRTQQKVAGC